MKNLIENANVGFIALVKVYRHEGSSNCIYLYCEVVNKELINNSLTITFNILDKENECNDGTLWIDDNCEDMVSAFQYCKDKYENLTITDKDDWELDSWFELVEELYTKDGYEDMLLEKNGDIDSIVQLAMKASTKDDAIAIMRKHMERLEKNLDEARSMISY